MKRTGIKWAATAACSVSVFVLCASVGNAGLIPWVWDAVFGPHCPQNRCYSAPCGGSYAAPSAYAPSPRGPSDCGIQSAFFAPFFTCSPCGTSFCGVSGCEYGACGPAGCPTGECGLSPATSERTSEPGTPRTYEGDADSTTDPKWNPTDNGAPRPEEEVPEVKANKPAAEPVPGKKGAAETLPFDEEEKEAETGPEDEAGGPKLFSLDRAVTWRPAVGRTRLQRRATYAGARIIRKPRHAKGKWIVVPSPANIAKR